MSDVVRLRNASDLEAERYREDVRKTALCLIEELGDQGRLPDRAPRAASEARARCTERLLAAVDVIEDEQGFGWRFRDAEETG